MKKLCLSALLLVMALRLMAVPAAPGLITVVLQDGSQVKARIYGDEYFHCVADEQGRLLEPVSSGLYRLTDRRISQVDFRQERAEAKRRMPGEPANKPQRQINRVDRTLVLLVSFTDKQFRNSQQAFDNLLNKEADNHNVSNGSARDYFITASAGQFRPDFDVFGPYQLDQNCAYYGANRNGNGSDQRAAQMVVDAVAKFVAQQGENALQAYDLDRDGYLDNIFVFYAGHGENAGGGTDCIWPHRSYVYPNYVNGRITYGGVTLFNYACSCELQGSSGIARSGIGPFCHEFSHVLGLPDLYDTQYQGYRTCSTWDIMDQGNYLNNEHTPPTYSAYERFYLGWLTPTVLSEPENGLLYDLGQSNTAYLICAGRTHNLDPANPSPAQFYLLENRQQSGWDSYLPGHGMLVTRVSYDEYAWEYNCVNNDSNNMGVDIIEAGGVKGDRGQPSDPFPGTDHVTSYNPINQPLTDIREDFGKITFKYCGGRLTRRVTFDAMGRGKSAQNKITEARPGSGITLPQMTNVARGYTFLGWSESSSTTRAEAGQPSEQYYPTADITLFAVYKSADTITATPNGCITETFDRVPGNGSEITTRMDKYTDHRGWSGNIVKEADGAIKMGDNNTVGILVTPRMHLSGDMTVTIRAKALINTTMIVTAENGRCDSAAVGKTYDELTFSLTAVPIDSRLKIECRANIFTVDSVEICGAMKSPVEETAAERPTLLRQGRQAVITGLAGDETITVFDATGRILTHGQTHGTEFSFTTAGQFIFVRVENKQGSITLK